MAIRQTCNIAFFFFFNRHRISGPPSRPLLSHLEQRKGEHRGDTIQWSHLEQKGGDREVLRGIETHWSHLGQKAGDQKVLGEVLTHWSQLKQRGGDQEVVRGDLQD